MPTTIECIDCHLKYLIDDTRTYACKCGKLFGQVKCQFCQFTQPTFFDIMAGTNQHWTCTTCETESILSPCQSCTNINLRGLKDNSCKCTCKTINYYLDCKQCLTWYTVNESKENLDGKLVSCVLSCEQFQVLKCTNCQTLKRIDNFNNEIKNYCSSCSKYFFKQICSICKEVSTYDQKDSQLRQKCQNKKCSKPTYLRLGKIQNQQVVLGDFIKANDIQQIQAPKQQQQTSKYLQHLDLLEIEQEIQDTKINPVQNQQNLLDIEENLVQKQECKSTITNCQRCSNSTELIITTPCGHKVTCFQCLETQQKCIQCGEMISNRIINTFNRDFYQEIIERISSNRQE